MSLQEFETLLKQNVGIDATALGRAAIDRAVRERAAACALPDWAGYLEHLRGSEDEMQALSDAIIQPEERFFRDRSAFEALSRLAVQGWLTAPHGEQLRLLSVGCGGGEEPYSMAIELLEAGFPADRLRIDAVDISAGALVRARQGVYSRLALEPADARLVERHFLPLSDGLRLDSRVRNIVTFFRANVLADNFLASTPEYDFIFCRQLLIYLDEPTQNRLVRSLYRALARQGVVFVGAGETAAIRKPDFVPIDIPGVSAFLKAGKRRVGEATETARAMGGSTSIPATTATRAPVIPTRTPLDLASKLAQRGQWADVTRLCESYIREQGECADAIFLLGEVQRAAGQVDGARWHYERALQLRPEHTMASLRLAQLPPLARESGSALRRAGYLPRLQP